MARLLTLGFVCVVLVGVVVVPGVAVGGEPTTPERSAAFATPDRFATTTFTIQVFQNGSARWRFTYYTNQLNDSETAQFRTFADRFRSAETDLWTTFTGDAQALVNAGAAATGRNMTASGFQRSAGVESVSTRGRVTMSFLWAEFARVTGDRLVVGDIFEGEFYIGPNQWLVFETGPDLSFVESAIDPQPDSYSGSSIPTSDTVTWTGEQRFPDNRPRVVFGVTDQSTTTATPAPTTAEPAGANSVGPLLIVGIVLLVVLGVGAAWISGRLDPVLDGGETTPKGGGDAATDSPTTGADTEPEAVDAQPETESPVAEEELLSDEDRVINLLETNGGRMKQANIVDETDWSKSKVSMLLSDMEDDEVISKLRVGRENIVSLSGHEPDAAGSPFDDED